MFQRLLVPLDESELAEQALAVAAQIARRSQGNMVLLECIIPPVELGPSIGEPPLLVQQAIETDTAMATHYLEEIVQKKIFADLVTETRIEYGWPAQCILAEARQQQSGLIVISSHGRSGLSLDTRQCGAKDHQTYLDLHRLLRINSEESDADRQGLSGRSMRTYVPVPGAWCSLSRAIDRDGNLVASRLRQKRGMDAAQRFFQPERVTTDGHHCSPRALRETLGGDVLHRCSHYLNHRMEQDHRGIRTTLLSHARFWKFHVGSTRVLARSMRSVNSLGSVRRLGNRFPSPEPRDLLCEWLNAFTPLIVRAS